MLCVKRYWKASRATKFRWSARIAIGAVLASILVIPFAATDAGASTTWHVNSGVESGMIFGPDGAFYFIGPNYQVLRMDEAGQITVLARLAVALECDPALARVSDPGSRRPVRPA